MADKFALMERQQTGSLGTLVPEVLYRVTAKSKATFDKYEERGFCKTGTQKQLEKLLPKGEIKIAPHPAADDETADGEDTVDAGEGDDTVVADDGGDTVAGGEGEDTVVAGEGGEEG